MPFITTDQMKEADKLATEKYGISLIQMMENAGLNLALVAKEVFLKNQFQDKKIYVVAGLGGNGGGAMVAARRLKSWGADAALVLSSTSGKFREETVHQFSILQHMGIKLEKSIGKADLIIDGLIGYGIKGDPNGNVAELINQINESKAPVLSLDAPSGLDMTTGKPGNPTVKAKATMTLAMPKVGLFKMTASKLIGDLYLADIGIPPEVFISSNGHADMIKKAFNENTVVKINKMVVFS